MGFPLGVGIHSKYIERIRKFKYRQGNRRTGEHLRVVLSIHNLTSVANPHRVENDMKALKDDSFERKKSGLTRFFNTF